MQRSPSGIGGSIHARIRSSRRPGSSSVLSSSSPQAGAGFGAAVGDEATSTSSSAAAAGRSVDRPQAAASTASASACARGSGCQQRRRPPCVVVRGSMSRKDSWCNLSAVADGGPFDQGSAVTGPAYRVCTPRLVIRCWHPADAPLLKAAIDESLDHLRPWMPWAQGEPQPLQHKVDLLRRFRGQFDLGQDGVFGIFDPAESRVLGGTGLHPRVGPRAREIGYWIHAGWIGQGLATEVAAALTRVAFEIEGVTRVEIHCAPDNARSAGVPRRLGFVHEATLRRRVEAAAGAFLRDTMIWTLLDEEFPASPAADVPVTAFDAAGRLIL